MKRTDTYSVKVTVDKVDLGTFDKMSGGEVDSEETTYRPGGLVGRISLGGQRTTGNVTVSTLLTETLHARYPWLVARSGAGEMIVTKQPLDTDGKAFGRPIIYAGTLKSVTPPDVDSNGNDAALLELVMTVAGDPS